MERGHDAEQTKCEQCKPPAWIECDNDTGRWTEASPRRTLALSGGAEGGEGPLRASGAVQGWDLAPPAAAPCCGLWP